MIRKANSYDFPSIVEIYNFYVSKGSSTMDTFKTSEDISSWVSKFNNREGLYVYEENSIIKGWVILKKYSDRYGYRFACETSIYVSKDYLRDGLGNLLNQFIIEKAKEFNYKHMTAKIFSNNKPSILFFEKYGYSIVGKQTRIGFRNEKWIDIIIMEKLI